MESIQNLIIGGGIIGLAIARAISLSKNEEVIILEKNPMILQETSSRNSEVIHAGIYYPPNSLKSKFCNAGRKLLYNFLEERKLGYKKTGKIIFTQDTNPTKIKALYGNAIRAGAENISFIGSQEITEIEPNLQASYGILSKETGIFDSHEFGNALIADSKKLDIALNSEVIGIDYKDEHYIVTIEGYSIKSKNLINAAGLNASKILDNFESFPKKLIPQTKFCKGNYFSLVGMKNPFKHLIYPMPEDHGLGVHLTIDLGGSVRFGPDTEWIEEIDYEVDPTKASYFLESVKKYFPDINGENLAPAYAGIRPKVFFDSKPFNDFCIQSQKEHGFAGLINCFGIESPGLTASLAIGEHISNICCKNI